MKVRLQPLYFKEANEREMGEFGEQMENLKRMYGAEAEFLTPKAVGETVPKDADAVVFAQLIGAAFRYKAELVDIGLPMIVLTSSFGTVEMWDWEIVTYLRAEGCKVFSPYSEQLARVILRGISVRRKLREGAKFLMFQDSPGEGMQAYIFKRFYWWEQECTKALEDAFGIRMVYKSWKAVAETAKAIGDDAAREVAKGIDVPCEGVCEDDFLRAVKLYMAINDAVNAEGDVEAVGCNCLNESFYSDSTPCLAWNLIFERERKLFVCEGDTLSLISKYIVYHATGAPIMMTNIYPFLMGMAALKHEKIQSFPEIDEPDKHALLAHCGYFGLVMREFAEQWTLRPKALEIVDEHALAVDARLPLGPITVAKLHPGMDKLIVIDAELEKYVQYPGSDCRNGAIIRYRDGHAVMDSLYSHHALIMTGERTHELKQLAAIFGWEVQTI